MITDDSSKKSEVLGLLCIRIGRLCRFKDQLDPLSRKIMEGPNGTCLGLLREGAFKQNMDIRFSKTLYTSPPRQSEYANLH